MKPKSLKPRKKNKQRCTSQSDLVKRKEPSTWQDLNPRPLVHEACTLLLRFYHCPWIMEFHKSEADQDVLAFYHSPGPGSEVAQCLPLPLSQHDHHQRKPNAAHLLERGFYLRGRPGLHGATSEGRQQLVVLFQLYWHGPARKACSGKAIPRSKTHFFHILYLMVPSSLSLTKPRLEPRAF